MMLTTTSEPTARRQIAILKEIVCCLTCEPLELAKRIQTALAHLLEWTEGLAAGVLWLEESGALHPLVQRPETWLLPPQIHAVLSSPTTLAETIQNKQAPFWLGVPIKSEGRLVGRLWVVAAAPRPFEQADVEVAKMVGNQLALTIVGARLYSEVQGLAAKRGALLQRVIGTQDERCRRFSRDLHDEICQSLTALSLDLEALLMTNQVVDPALRQRLTRMQGSISLAQEELERIILDLRPILLEDMGLLAALRWYAAQRLADQEVQVHVGQNGSELRLPPHLETTLYRIGQEALTNVAKHAAARHIWLNLTLDDHTAILFIRDDGRGFRLAEDSLSENGRPGLGLFGMRERVSLVGGQLKIASAPGAGTCVSATVPLGETD